jgi:hypothetical protein
MNTYDAPLISSPVLDASGIRAYATYFAVWFVPGLLGARAVAHLLEGSGALHATLYVLALVTANQRLLERFFHGQRRIVQYRERHRLALHCAGVTAISSLILTWFAARIGLVAFTGEAQRSSITTEVMLLTGLPLLWVTDYVLFRLVFSEFVCLPLFARWRRKNA